MNFYNTCESPVNVEAENHHLDGNVQPRPAQVFTSSGHVEDCCCWCALYSALNVLFGKAQHLIRAALGLARQMTQKKKKVIQDCVMLCSFAFFFHVRILTCFSHLGQDRFEKRQQKRKNPKERVLERVELHVLL